MKALASSKAKLRSREPAWTDFLVPKIPCVQVEVAGTKKRVSFIQFIRATILIVFILKLQEQKTTRKQIIRSKDKSQQIAVRNCSTGYNPLTSNQVVYKWFSAPTFHHSDMALAIRLQLSCLTGPDNGAYAVYTHIDVPPDTGEQKYCYPV